METYCRRCEEYHEEDNCRVLQDRQFMRQIDEGYDRRNLTQSERDYQEMLRFRAEYYPGDDNN